MTQGVLIFGDVNGSGGSRNSSWLLRSPPWSSASLDCCLALLSYQRGTDYHTPSPLTTPLVVRTFPMPPNESTGLLEAGLLQPAPALSPPSQQQQQPPSTTATARAYWCPRPDAHVRTRDVDYDMDSHFSVLFQMQGSVWPKVLRKSVPTVTNESDMRPVTVSSNSQHIISFQTSETAWCLVTMVFTYAIIALRDAGIVNLTIKNSTGHSFMSLLVSFLVVTRATITYNRFMEARQGLTDLYSAAREVVQYACLLSMENTGAAAVKWRQDVAYRTIVCLRMATAAVEFRSKGVSAWESLEEPDQDVEERNTSLGNPGEGTPTEDASESQTDHSSFLRLIAHGPRTDTDENFRAAVVWIYNLRETCMAPRRTGSSILTTRPFHVNEDLKFMTLTRDFIAAYDGLKKLITTPFPFPLVQMTRTFLFFWVFSLPLVFADDNDRTSEVLILMFFCTCT